MKPLRTLLSDFFKPAVEIWSALPKHKKIALGAVPVLLVAIFILWPRPKAAVRLTYHHAFRQAIISIWIDGDLVHQGQISGTARKKSGVVQRVEGNYAKTFTVSPGHHTIQVRVQSVADSFDKTRVMEADVAPDSESVLSVNAAAVNAAGAPAVTTTSFSIEPYKKYVSSMLLTAGGSIFSAAIAFFVQEFLRRARNRSAAGVPATVQVASAQQR